jgi:DUF1680 family protein
MSRAAPRPLALKHVTIDDAFWSPRLETKRRVTLMRAYELCRSTGRIGAFELDWLPGNPRKPHYFWDSDVAKWIEAASYSLAAHHDRRLERKLDRVIAQITSAQQLDGYLNVYFTVVEPQKRWTNLRDWHELYCAGHLIEAGVAHIEATGRRTLLDVVARYADHIDATFGRGDGQRAGYPGHEEVELAQHCGRTRSSPDLSRGDRLRRRRVGRPGPVCDALRLPRRSLSLRRIRSHAGHRSHARRSGRIARQ